MKKKYQITGMTCSACSNHVLKSVKKVDGVKEVNVNLITNSMEVETTELVTDLDVINAVIAAGYGAKTMEKVEELNYDKKEKTVKVKLTLSIIFLILLMYVSMGHMLHFPLPNILLGTKNALIFAITQVVLLIPIVILNSHYFTSGYKKLFKRSPNMDSLIAIGSSAAIIYGLFVIGKIIYAMSINNYDIVEKYHMELYFESAGMILTLVSVGKYIESMSKNKTSEALKKIMSLASTKAIVIENGMEVSKDINDVKVDDILICKPGMSIAVDGIIIEGESTIDESAITGESIPVYKEKGDFVTSATINTYGSVIYKATKTFENSTISEIIRMVEEASGSKAPVQQLADKISGIFVPIVMLISLVSMVIWLIFSHDFEFSLSIGISVLVISCPCALGLATPVAIMVSTGIGASNHILIKSAEALEVLHNVDTVMLDKTGTITEGKPVVDEIISINGTDNFDILVLVSSLEKLSSHPFAKAILSFDSNLAIKSVDKYETIMGYGLSGEIDGKKYYAGNLRYINQVHTDFNYDLEIYEGKSFIFLFDDKEVIGLITISDKIKETSKFAIKQFKKMKINTVMLTGDNQSAASLVKNNVIVDEVFYELTPANKASIITKFQKEGHKVLMIGDGINDSVALTSADVGMALGAGTDVAIESADIVLVKNDLLDAVNAVMLSKKTMKNIKMNLFWAFFYNIIGIPIAAGIFYPLFNLKLNPMIASLAMSFSSVFVCLNALRLRKFKKIEYRGENMKQEFIVNGMTCGHCSSRVQKALEEKVGTGNVSVDLKKKIVSVDSDVSIEELFAIVKEAGYDPVVYEKKKVFKLFK